MIRVYPAYFQKKSDFETSSITIVTASFLNGSTAMINLSPKNDSSRIQPVSQIVRGLIVLALWLVTAYVPVSAQTTAPERISLSLEEGKSGAVWDCCVSPDGLVVYSCGRDSTVKAWNT